MRYQKVNTIFCFNKFSSLSGEAINLGHLDNTERHVVGTHPDCVKLTFILIRMITRMSKCRKERQLRYIAYLVTLLVCRLFYTANMS